MGSFLQDIFLRFGGSFNVWNGEQDADQDHPSCSGTLEQAVEYVVDATFSRLRFLPSYARRLRRPVAATFRHIDELVEDFPGAILCSQSAFSEDPRVNAFFVDPRHLREVFSESEQVRELFDTNPDTEECYALLCMKKEERRRLGMALVGELVQKEVMQTTVSFTDHQFFSPSASEAEARHSLKCCIFNGLLAHIRKREREERIRVIELEDRRGSLVSRLNRTASEGDGESRDALQGMIADIGRELMREIPRLASPEYHFDLLTDVLGNPTQYVSGSPGSIHLSRLGIKLEGGRSDSGDEIPLFEIQVASQGTRIGALVRFPRADLLPRQDFVRKADLFATL
ncbi:MAG: hypothetical protein LJE70_00825 [Chromatiaceae bacterium]|nr:hypothetical protein [Chromatiaceae bacterium]